MPAHALFQMVVFVEQGLESLRLPPDFNFIGPMACENCKRLIEVDLMCTDIICNPKGKGGNIDDWPSMGTKRTNPLHMESVDILISEEAQQDMDLSCPSPALLPSNTR